MKNKKKTNLWRCDKVCNKQQRNAKIKQEHKREKRNCDALNRAFRILLLNFIHERE